jgi:hypothetical protein
LRSWACALPQIVPKRPDFPIAWCPSIFWARVLEFHDDCVIIPAGRWCNEHADLHCPARFGRRNIEGLRCSFKNCTLHFSPAAIGPDYLSHAFRFAHEAGPDAELYYNDYYIEKGGKHRSLLLLLKRLSARKRRSPAWVSKDIGD